MESFCLLSFHFNSIPLHVRQMLSMIRFILFSIALASTAVKKSKDNDVALLDMKNVKNPLVEKVEMYSLNRCQWQREFSHKIKSR